MDNATEQFLQVELPAGAALWTAVVAGEPVKPVEDPAATGRRVSIPLVKTAAGERDYAVMLKYGGKTAAAGAAQLRRLPPGAHRRISTSSGASCSCDCPRPIAGSTLAARPSAPRPTRWRPACFPTRPRRSSGSPGYCCSRTRSPRPAPRRPWTRRCSKSCGGRTTGPLSTARIVSWRRSCKRPPTWSPGRERPWARKRRNGDNTAREKSISP